MSETIETKLMQAVGRAYTHDINSNKEVDANLGESIVSEIEPIFYSLQSTIEDQEKTIRELEWQRDGLMSSAEVRQYKLSQSNKERDMYREALERIKAATIEAELLHTIAVEALKEGEEDESK